MLIVPEKILNNLMQRVRSMLFHIGKDILHRDSGLLTRHSRIGHYQKNNIAQGSIFYLHFLFHPVTPFLPV